MSKRKVSPIGKKAETVTSIPGDQTRAIDLSSLFNVAAQALTANQSSLNQADTENQNHGDNMVQVFNTIAQVMANQQGASPSQQLNSASQYLAQHGTSGSAHVYSQGLAQAAQQFQGQSAVTPDNAMMLVQSLLGGGQAASSQGGNLLGSLLGSGQSSAQSADLLGSLLGGQSAPQGSGQPSAQGADLLGSLLGGQSTPQGQSGSQQQGGIDLGDVLNAGMTFLNAKQEGQSNLQAALSALMAAGPLGQKPHRQESGQVVANALLQFIGNMAKQ
ncbi:hypothetical protein ANAEL_04978 [Anaerolineales bacterium]|nr:hypothetical protein ANAEL_04978 [Anaerolineales bacterium]